MSDTTTPDKGQNKRRGLALPPRGQTLARLQDLEADVLPDVADEKQETLSHESLEAVNTASSNAVNTSEDEPIIGNRDEAATTGEASHGTAPTAVAPAIPVPAAVQVPALTQGRAYRPAPRAAREPTTRITVDMPDSLHRQISMLSAETRRSIKELVIEALETTYFRKQEDGP